MPTIEAFKAAAGDGRVAPYNFVRIEPHVMPSPVAEQLSHGRPLKDGLCGELVVRWVVETPLLVGGSADGNSEPFKVGADHALPGASLRGLTRATLEVAAYSRLEPFIADRYFGIRNYEHASWKNRLPRRPNSRDFGRVHYPGGIAVPGRPAWLVPREPNDLAKGWVLHPCDMVLVPVREILAAAKLAVSEGDWNRSTVPQKQTLLPASFRGIVPVASFGTVQDPFNGNSVPGASLGSRAGTLVMAGPWASWEGNVRDRRYESLFLEPGPGDTSNAIPISKEVMKRFKTAEPAEAENAPTPRTLWRYWLSELRDGRAHRIPVFYEGDPALAASDTAPAPKDFFFSLTRLMRIPHLQSVATVAARTQKEPPTQQAKLDFCQALFGHVPDEAAPPLHSGPVERAWRSRVFFGQALLKTGTLVDDVEKTGATMSPKPSFYPYYLRPKPAGGAVRHPYDWSNQDTVLAGRKRYVPRGRAGALPQPPAGSEQTTSQMRFIHGKGGEPLVFSSRIRFHNLLPEELGGLVWALTLGEHGVAAEQRRRRHMLGRAKAYGHGQTLVLIDETASRIIRNDNGARPALAECVARFEGMVSTWHPDNGQTVFRQLPQVGDLLAMTDLALGRDLDPLLKLPDANPSNDADRVVAGYVKLKQRTYNHPVPHQPSYQVPGNAPADAFTLPLYPWPEPD